MDPTPRRPRAFGGQLGAGELGAVFGREYCAPAQATSGAMQAATPRLGEIAAGCARSLADHGTLDARSAAAMPGTDPRA